jgi:2-isopropylmalate synthase
VADLRTDRDLIHDWNAPAPAAGVAGAPVVSVHDETLRDGVQCPSVVDPAVDDKVAIVHMLAAVGVQSVDVGLPAASRRAYGDALRLCREIADQQLPIRPACAGRTLEQDLAPIVDVSQATGLAVEVMTFIGASPIRHRAEGWSLELVRQRTIEAVRFAVRHGLPVTFVTEDTTRSRPDDLATLFRAAMDEGASRLCLCDTVGHASPDGVRRLVGFARDLIQAAGCDVTLDWHGHNDRGLALANSLVAIEAGADRVHGCVLGIGERVGNASLDQLIVNLSLMGRYAAAGVDLAQLTPLCHKVSEATRFPIPDGYPLMGADAYRTGSGIHAAAILKASGDGDGTLAEHIYAAVPASMLGRSQEICVGPMSGASNVVHWLRNHGYPASPEVVSRILNRAKEGDRVLTEQELHHLVTRQLRRATG